MNKLEVLQQTISECNKCELSKSRTKTVFARGNPSASICIIAEAPGQDEDLQGLPFVGRSGQFLDKALASLSLDINNDVYITNIIRCRPPGNRKPESLEISSCLPYLEEQINIVAPKVIITLGNTALQTLMKIRSGVTKIRGKWQKYNSIDLMATFHPSYIIRSGGISSSYFIDFIADLKMVIERVSQ